MPRPLAPAIGADPDESLTNTMSSDREVAVTDDSLELYVEPSLRRRPRISTVVRLATFHALVIASVLAIVVFQFTQAFSNQSRTTLSKNLSENVAAFTRAAAARPAKESLPAFARIFLASQASSPSNFTIIALPGDHLILGTPGSGKWSKIPVVAKSLDQAPSSATFFTLSVAGGPETFLAVPVVSRGRRVGTFLTAGSLASYEATRARMFHLALAEGLILLVAAFVSVYLLLSRLLGTVRRLTHTAAEIGSRGELGVRLEGDDSGDEVGEMAATFNEMIGRIDAAVSLQRQMMANVSHQLRSPITVARGHLDVMSRGPLNDASDVRATVATVIEELDRMSRLIDRLMLLGRSLEVDNVDIRPVDVRALLLDLSSSFDVLADREWSVGPIPDVIVYADLDKVRSAVLNLVENAVQATQPHDAVHLWARVAGPVAEPVVELIVDDCGPGIDPAQRASVLERFASGAAGSAGGTGLGLAIVGAVARSHGGSVRLGDAPRGGCRATLVLPLPPPGSEYSVEGSE